jgi:transcription elongation factor GreB
MSKAFTRESDDADADDDPLLEHRHPIQGAKNYITPAGYARLKTELKALVERERPEVVRTVSWAASNGDRSENGDYIYGKRRLREIDGRIHYLIKRLENAEVVHPRSHDGDDDRVFFGVTVDYADRKGAQHTISIVGLDEVDLSRGRISWISPVAKALLKAQVGDTVLLRTPGGAEELEVLDIRYEALD